MIINLLTLGIQLTTNVSHYDLLWSLIKDCQIQIYHKGFTKLALLFVAFILSKTNTLHTFTSKSYIIYIYIYIYIYLYIYIYIYILNISNNRNTQYINT